MAFRRVCTVAPHNRTPLLSLPIRVLSSPGNLAASLFQQLLCGLESDRLVEVCDRTTCLASQSVAILLGGGEKKREQQKGRYRG
jgi:hypothetical protein